MKQSKSVGISRRQLLRGAVGFGGLLAARAVAPSIVCGQGGPRIVVIGGGLAGLTAAWRLWTRYGLRAEVYEAKPRLGGRASTHRGFPGGHAVERGGQFISTNDRRLRRLLRRLDVPLIDTEKVGFDGDELYHFVGRTRSYDELRRGLRRAEAAAEMHAQEVVHDATYRSADDRTRYWDSLSVAEWVAEHCPGGLTGAAGQYLKVDFETDYAGPAETASALHLIYELGLEGGGGYDERYVVRGGTDRVVEALAAGLPDSSAHLGTRLTRLREAADGSVICTFDGSGGTMEVKADRVVLALPFRVLREVDYAGIDFGERKDRAIQTLGMGRNAKVHLQFDTPVWQPDYNGDSLSDGPAGATWVENFDDVPSPSTLVCMTAPSQSDFGSAVAHGPAPAAVVSSYLDALDALFPGASASFNGNAYLDHWLADPYARGSYSFYEVGQFTGIAGVEAEPRGNVYFAGEHTARYAMRGLLNGAVETGWRAAQEVARSL